MADGGVLYRILDSEIIPAMQKLIRHATAITPNVTEAALLLGRRGQDRPQSLSEAKKWALELAKCGPSQVYLTSLEVPEFPGQTGILGYWSNDNSYKHLFSPKIDHSLPGAGDYFAAALSGALACGEQPQIALTNAWQKLQVAVKQIPNTIRQADGSLVSEGISL
jgi:pyridoxine kinase